MKKFLILILCLFVLVSTINIGVTASGDSSSTIMGDVNSDGSVNNTDLALLMKYINGWNITINIVAANTNGDSTINNKDYALLIRFINGWDVELSQPKDDDIGIQLPLDKW